VSLESGVRLESKAVAPGKNASFRSAGKSGDKRYDRPVSPALQKAPENGWGGVGARS